MLFADRLEPNAFAFEDYVKRQLPPSSYERRIRRATTSLCTSSGAVVDAARTRRAPHRRERRVLGHPEPAVNLDRAIDHLAEHARGVELDQRDLDARLVPVVDALRGLHRHQPARLDLGGRLGDPVLHRLLVGKRLAERLALERVRAHQVERTLHLPEPAHHVMDAARPEPLLRDAEAAAALAEQVRRRHAHVGEARLAMRPPPASLVAHHRDPPYELVSWRVGRDDDHRRTAMRLCVGIGDDHDDPEAGAVRARGEPLVRVDHPLVAVELGSTLQARGVGAGDLRLGHPEEGARRTGDERLEEATLLVVGAEHVQDLAVAGIGRLASEDELRIRASPDLLVQIGVLDEAAAAAARLGRQVRRPEAGVLGELLQLRDERVGGVVFPGKRLLVRIDVLLHERAHLVATLGDAVGDDNGRHGQQ